MREGWELKKLGDVCSVLNGYAFKSKDTVEQSDTQLLRMGNLYQNKLDLNRKPVFYPSSFVDDYSDYVLKTDDLIMSLTGTVDKTDYGYTVRITSNKVNLLLNQRIMKITVLDNKKMDDKYLHLFLLSPEFLEALYATANGTRQANLSSRTILTLSIPIPPLKEQKQIVTTLDKAFKQIEQAKANLEKNLNNAKELFQSKLNEVFSQRGEGWEEKKLKEITTKIGSGSTPRGGQASYKESGLSLIRSMNVHDDGFREKKLAFIDDEQALKLKNVTLEKEDILLNITGASVARCCIVPDEYLPARVNQHVSIIRLKENILHPSYLHYCLTAQENKNKLLNIGRQGATREAITKVQIENFIVSYPKDMTKQLEVLEELNVIKEKSSLLETHYQQKLNNLEELKKSILQKAFKGELAYQ